MFQSPRSGEFVSKKMNHGCQVQGYDIVFQSPRSGEFVSNNEDMQGNEEIPFVSIP